LKLKPQNNAKGPSAKQLSELREALKFAQQSSGGPTQGGTEPNGREQKPKEEPYKTTEPRSKTEQRTLPKNSEAAREVPKEVLEDILKDDN